jgi:hypothetical protein
MWIKAMNDSTENVMLVVAGLHNQLSGYRHWLLHFPWSQEEFVHCISSVVGNDIISKETFESLDVENQIFEKQLFWLSYPSMLFPEEAGLKTWIVKGRNYPVLKMVEDGAPLWTDLDPELRIRDTLLGKKFGKIISALEQEALSINFVWPNNDPKDRKALLEVERILVAAIKDRGVNFSLSCS